MTKWQGFDIVMVFDKKAKYGGYYTAKRDGKILQEVSSQQYPKYSNVKRHLFNQGYVKKWQ